MIAARAPMPIKEIGINKPNNARLGTVCITFAKPRIGVWSDLTRVSKTPRGTPIKIATPVEMRTRKMCSRVKTSSSGQFDLRNS